MRTSAPRKTGSQTLATVDRLVTHLALLAEAKAALDGVDLNAGVLKPTARRSLQRALAYPSAHLDKPRLRRKRR
jgi:hypothetical protein